LEYWSVGVLGEEGNSPIIILLFFITPLLEDTAPAGKTFAAECD
jgi:hypothetical protein